MCRNERDPDDLRDAQPCVEQEEQDGSFAEVGRAEQAPQIRIRQRLHDLAWHARPRQGPQRPCLSDAVDGQPVTERPQPAHVELRPRLAPIIIGRYARTLHERGDLREGITLEQARDVLWTISPPELYELLVLRRGWSVDRFVAFQAERSIAALLPLEAPLWE